MRGSVIVLIFFVLFSAQAAICNVSGTVTASASTCSSIGTGDTMLITGTLNLNSDYAVHVGNDIVVIVDGGSIVWNGNFGFDLGSGASLLLTNGGGIVNGSGSCNANKVISFGGIDISSCNGGGAAYSFADIITAGGITASSPVPVSLIHFSFETHNNINTVHWSTASEFNHDKFELLRSYDSRHFEIIYTEFGDGNSSGIKNYTYEDNTNHISTIYYKLDQYDFDGHLETFNILKVEPTKIISIVYPNPFNNEVTISEIPEYIDEIIVYNLLGTEVHNELLESNYKKINTKEWSPGIYYIQVGTERLKVVKQ